AEFMAIGAEKLLPDLAENYRHARAVIAVSNQNLCLLHTIFGLPPFKGQVIYYGRPDRYFQRRALGGRERMGAELDISADDVGCLTTARFEKTKGCQFQLTALKHLRRLPEWDRLHFVWIGAGSTREQVATTLEKEHWFDRVHLLGHRWDVADWLDAA